MDTKTKIDRLIENPHLHTHVKVDSIRGDIMRALESEALKQGISTTLHVSLRDAILTVFTKE